MTVVLKIGGSLLDLPDLKSRLQRLIATECSDKAVFVVVGGGLIVDAIRHYDSIHRLETQRCHWLCVELMNQTAALLQQITDWPLIKSESDLANQLSWSSPSSAQNPALIVAPSAFYSPNSNSTSLPISWSTTSDSIAALLARIVLAQELVMLKSTEESQTDTEPLMDESFSDVVSPGLKVRVINLRAPLWSGGCKSIDS